MEGDELLGRMMALGWTRQGGKALRVERPSLEGLEPIGEVLDEGMKLLVARLDRRESGSRLRMLGLQLVNRFYQCGVKLLVSARVRTEGP
jgi:hypothetical protein